MKRTFSSVGHALFLLVTVALASLTVTGQPIRENLISQTDYAVTERGPHHNRVSREVQVRDESGEVITREQSYVELATGMNFFENDEWKPADTTVELFEGGAIARKLQQTIIFSPNLMTEAGTIDFQTPDGQRLRAAPLALAYYDPVTGQDAIIAVTKASIGEVHGASRVVYPNAFEGIDADIVYDVRLSGFSQDIVLREQLPPAEDFGLNSELVRLEVLTEFLEAPEPQKDVRVISQVDDPVLRGLMVSPDLVDEELTFGTMKFGPGRAFSNNQAEELAEGDTDSGVRVGKRWVEQGGRKVLFESVDFFEISPFLEELPERKNQASIGHGPLPEQLALSGREIPKRQSTKESVGIRIASVVKPRPGFVLDYETLNSSQTNFTFKANETYHVTDHVDLYETTTLEGGTVIKYEKYASPPYTRLWVRGSFECKTAAYRPAHFVSEDDDTVGEVISGSSGSPSGFYGYHGIAFISTGEDVEFSYGVFRNCLVGIYRSGASDNQLRHLQFVDTKYPIWISSADCDAGNILADDSDGQVITSNNSTVATSHLTSLDATEIYELQNGGTTTYTNCLFVATTNSQTYNGSNNTDLSSATGVFETVGSADFYLASGSPHRNAGTTSIDSTLAADLKQMTTYPPVVISGDLDVDTTLFEQAQRDTDTPDLGYHYTPIDYALDVVVKDSTLTILPGTAIVSHNYRAIRLQDGSHLECVGSPTARIHLARNYGVQEQPEIWGTRTYTERSVITRDDGSAPPTATIRFTDFDGISGGGWQFHTKHGYWEGDNVSISDCRFFAGDVLLDISSGDTLTLKNNLFLSVNADIDYKGTVNSYNNLFLNGDILIDRESTAGTWTFKDNAFEDVTISHTGTVSNSHNGYIGAGQDTLTGSSGNDQTPTTFTYGSGPLGEYYQVSTAFEDVGSRTAAAAGLYHHTTLTGNEKDTSTVDIGFHYVAMEVDGTNIAESETATQSSTYSTAAASRAVDGDTDGDYANGSVSHTESESEAWWHVDLGAVNYVDAVRIWNRDYGQSRLSDFYIFVSDNAFSSTTVSTTLAQAGVNAYYFDGAAGDVETVPIGRTGRYVRVQLTGSNYLHMAEVQLWSLWGTTDTDGDGVADYLEDSNSNGTFDSGETDWNSSNTELAGASDIIIFSDLID